MITISPTWSPTLPRQLHDGSSCCACAACFGVVKTRVESGESGEVGLRATLILCSDRFSFCPSPALNTTDLDLAFALHQFLPAIRLIIYVCHLIESQQACLRAGPAGDHYTNRGRVTPRPVTSCQVTQEVACACMEDRKSFSEDYVVDRLDYLDVKGISAPNQPPKAR